MLTIGRFQRRSRLVDGLVGAASGLFATWVMDLAQDQLRHLGGEATRRREREAERAAGEPATFLVAERVAGLLGRELDPRQRRVGGNLVHHAMGALAGAAFGAWRRELGRPSMLGGVAFGAALWLVMDEATLPLLRLARGPGDYPASVHARALAAHVVYGAATEGAYQVLSQAVR